VLAEALLAEVAAVPDALLFVEAAPFTASLLEPAVVAAVVLPFVPDTVLGALPTVEGALPMVEGGLATVLTPPVLPAETALVGPVFAVGEPANKVDEVTNVKTARLSFIVFIVAPLI